MKKTLLGITLLCMLVVTGCTMPWNKKDTEHGAGEDVGNIDDLLAGVDQEMDKEKVIACLKDKGATFYGGQTCGYSCADVAVYGKDMKNFTCVECDTDAGKDECEALGIAELPVWGSQGKIAKEIKSIDDLAVAFGCN